MSVRWDRVFAFVLFLTAMVLGVRYRHAITGFLSNIERIGPGHSPDEQTLGLIACGFLLVCLVATVRILTRDK